MAGQTKPEAYAALKGGAPALFDPDVVAALGEALGDERRYVIQQVGLRGLRDRMILAEDMFVSRGGQQVKVLAKGTELSSVALEHIFKLARYDTVTEPIKVIVPLAP
jgi:hypothetical protein